jgi:hypothetical protein
MAYKKQLEGSSNMKVVKFAACWVLLSAGVYSAAPADEPPVPATQSPATQTPTAPPAAALAPASSAPSSAGDEKSAPSVASGAGDAKPASDSAAVNAPKADKSEVVVVAATDAEIKQMRSRGYKPVNRNGTLVFCRDEAEIGSHFQRTRCSTLKQLKDAELSGKEYVNSLQQQGSAVPFRGP